MTPMILTNYQTRPMVSAQVYDINNSGTPHAAERPHKLQALAD